MQISRESLIDAKLNRVAVVFNNVFTENYKWINFIDFLNYAIKQNNQDVPLTNASTRKGFVNFWHDLTMTIDRLEEKFFPNLEDYNKTLSSYHPNKNMGRFAAVSFTDSEPTTGKHTDPVDVMYWNCVGVSQWEVFYENDSTVFVLNPGDVIFVPARTLHEVTSLSPRAAISFMFGENE
jgi:hypothetical protein